MTIPVIGNGDVDGPERAKQMLDETGCDAVMIGRAALGRPWIFAEIHHYLKTGEILPEPRIADRLSVAWEQLETKVAQSRSTVGAIKHLRKQMAAYFHGLPRASDVRGVLMQAESVDALRTIFADYTASQPDVDPDGERGWLREFTELDRQWMKQKVIAA